MSFAPTNQTPTAAGGTGKNNTNQPAPFGVAQGGGNGGGKYGQLPGELTNAVNNVMPAINDTVNQLDQYAQQAGATPAAGGGKYGKTGPMSDQQQQAIGAQNNFLTGGVTPSYNGGMGKAGGAPAGQSAGGMTPQDAMNRYNNVVFGASDVYNRNLAPTQQVGAALPTMRPAVGAPQPFSPTKQLGRALPGQPSTMPVAAPRLPAPVKLAPLQPNFRTGGLSRPGPARFGTKI
jgi:hypothetical protein